MSTENNSDIPFTFLNDGKRLLYSGTQEPRLLDLFPVGAEEPKLLELFPVGAHEHRLLELFPAGAQEPRLLQLFPVGGEPEDDDGTQRSDPPAGASEPDLPNLPAKHYSQPPTSLVLAQRSGNSLALDRSVQVMLNSLIREWRSLSLDNASNETEGFPSRISNSLSKLTEHTIRPAAENVTTFAAAAISICRPHNTRDLPIGPVTADQSGSSPAGRGLAKTRPAPIQELMPTRAKHLSRRRPERDDSANRSLPASIEHISKGQLAAQEPLTPGSVNKRSAVGGQLVTMRPPIRVEPMLENAKNLTMLATTALPPPTRWVNINPVVAGQSRRSHTGWGLTKNRSLAVQKPLPTRSENVGRRQPERDDLVNLSLPASREHVRQRLPSHIGPVKRRRLVVQEPLPSRQESMRGQLGNIISPARGEPMLEHGNQRPPIGGELVLRHVNVRPAPGQHNMNTRPSVRSRPRPQRPHKSPEPTIGGEPVLRPVDIRAPAGQQAGKTRSSVRSRARPQGPDADPRPRTGGPVLGHVNISVPAGQQDLNTRSSASSTGAKPRRPPAGKKPANRRHLSKRGGLPRRKSSAYKGVTHYLRTGRWEANIWHDGKQRYLGASATEIQAARAYDRALIHFRGVEALLNFNLNDYTGELGQLSNIRSADLIPILRKQSKGPGKAMPDYGLPEDS